MSVTTVRLQPDIEEHLAAMAGQLRRSKSWLINQALAEYIERQTQEQSRWEQTLSAMESVARGELVSATATHDWLHSWGGVDELPAPKAGE